MSTPLVKQPRLDMAWHSIALRQPGPDAIEHFRSLNQDVGHSYAPVGATRGELPEGWDHDEYEVRVGDHSDFDAAVECLRSWVMFDLGWVSLHPQSRQDPGSLVTFHTRQYGVWMLHACRVIYSVNTPDVQGFAYGTLAGHAVAGEEQFLVRRDEHGVHYGVRKFSRLQHPAARLAGPIARRLQHTFSVLSATRMVEAVRAKR